jgi:hypothetical protein
MDIKPKGWIVLGIFIVPLIMMVVDLLTKLPDYAPYLLGVGTAVFYLLPVVLILAGIVWAIQYSWNRNP